MRSLLVFAKYSNYFVKYPPLGIAYIAAVLERAGQVFDPLGISGIIGRKVTVTACAMS